MITCVSQALRAIAQLGRAPRLHVRQCFSGESSMQSKELIITQPGFIIRKTSTVEVHATQPKKDDGELTEMGTKDFSRDRSHIILYDPGL